MPVITTGGSLVTSESIVNGSIVNEDIATAAAIAQSKIAGLAEDGSDLIDIVVENDSSVDIVLDGNTKIVVFAKGNLANTGNETVSIDLRQDTVVKDTVTSNQASGGDQEPFALMYSETPAADTYTIDVVNGSGGGQANVKIIIFKFRVA